MSHPTSLLLRWSYHAEFWKLILETQENSKWLLHSFPPQLIDTLPLIFIFTFWYFSKEWPSIFGMSTVLFASSCTMIYFCNAFSDAGVCRRLSERKAGWVVSYIYSPYFSCFTLIVSLLSLVQRYYFNRCVDITKDMTSVGFDYLSKTARRRRKSTKEMAQEILQKRNPGQTPPVFPNGWIPVLESRDLKVGLTKPVSAIGREFAVFRGQDKKAYILDAFCPHLGANLSVGGLVKGNCIECPFHGWLFRGDDGACVGIPYTTKIPDVAKIRTWPSCETNGFIYVWYHAEGLQPYWSMKEIAEVDNGCWVYRGRTEHLVRCHIQEIPENGADVAHLHQIHSCSVFSGTDLGNIFSSLWTFLKHEWEPNWRPEESPNDHIAKISLHQNVSAFGYKLPFTGLKMDIYQIGPATVHLHVDCSFGKGVLLQHIVPEGPLEQRIVHQFYTHPSFKQHYANWFLRAEAVMLERDIMIWNNKKFVKNPILLKEEKLISRYRRWYSQFFSEHSPRIADLRDKLDW